MTTEIPSLRSLWDKANSIFVKEFGKEPTHAATCPGRVNLIGEHVDYCDGFVLPMALPLTTIMVGTPIEGTKTTIYSDANQDNAPKGIFEMAKKGEPKDYRVGCPRWLNYVKGVLAYHHDYPPAFEAVIVNSVPIGGGLSSSASLELSVYTFLDALCGSKGQSSKEKALACVEAEHEFGKVPCGNMDQMIGVLGQEGHALLLDCRDLSTEQIPFNEPDIVVLITNSNVKHQLDGSEYSTRRKQCEEAAKLMNKSSLRDANSEDVEKLKSLNANPDIIKRARHVVGEIKRTKDAADALKARDFQKFGKLMKESHFSLRDDFGVSCAELDSLVDIALASEGVIGSRMTGGGFGGCTVTLVYAKAAESLMKNIKEKYKGTPTFFICKPSQGARILQPCQH